MEDILALHRYYIWANRLREHFDVAISRTPLGSNANSQTYFADDVGLFMSHWYAALYVVVEGWKKLELSDPQLDQLLSAPHIELLKRYRNGVYHFQKNYFDPRFSELFEAKEAKSVAPWVRELNLGFGRYFLERLSD